MQAQLNLLIRRRRQAGARRRRHHDEAFRCANAEHRISQIGGCGLKRHPESGAAHSRHTARRNDFIARAGVEFLDVGGEFAPGQRQAGLRDGGLAFEPPDLEFGVGKRVLQKRLDGKLAPRAELHGRPGGEHQHHARVVARGHDVGGHDRVALGELHGVGAARVTHFAQHALGHDLPSRRLSVQREHGRGGRKGERGRAKFSYEVGHGG